MDKFDRGTVFVSVDNGNLYVLVRESRPKTSAGGNVVKAYAYNLFNLEEGKMRYTTEDKVFWNNEPVSAADLSARFGLELFPIAHISESIPLMREWAQDYLTKPSPRELALAALASR